MIESNRDCIYRKVGRKYVPIGVCEPINWIPNGIWYVRTKPGVKSRTNCEFIGEMLKIGDSEDISLNIQCGLDDLCEEVYSSKEYREVLNNKEGYCIQDLIHVICKVLYNKFKN